MGNAMRRSGRGRGFGVFRATLVVTLLVGSLVVAAERGSDAAVPAGFADTVVISGLNTPTAVRFAADGRIFVAQKNGQIYTFDASGGSKTLFADLSTGVHNFWDRGLLGLALAPTFPSDPAVYVLYTYDAPIGGTAPKWNDACPTPPGPTTDGCVASARLSKLTPSATPGAPTETVLVSGWCQQFPSHSIGTVLFGADGYLYAGAGEAASFNNVDYGQYGDTYAGDQANPCGDPPSPAGTALSPPTAEGGALRSQSVRRTDGPVTLDGTIIRVDPATGAGVATNPFGASTGPNKKRVLAYGLRNPFRFTTRPGTNELWIGDVGSGTWEEIDRVADTTGGTAKNFGWPCYEGSPIASGFQSANVTMCNSLYNNPSLVTAPFYSYKHSDLVVSGDTCPTANGSAISGMAFYSGGSYPASYNGGLFFADHSRRCIWFMPAGVNGVPDPLRVQAFAPAAGNPVDLEIGPGGDLFYADLEGGSIHRIRYTATNQPPVATFTAQPTAGPTPLTVQFDGRGSSDPEGRALTYAWDLDGNGAYDNGSAAQVSWIYNTAGVYTARLRVTDPQGAVGTASVTITPGNSPPVPAITTPSASLKWKVGDTINFSGRATDTQDGTEPASRLSWTLFVHHCTSPTDCHVHNIQTFTGVASGAFSAPDHGYPVHLELQLVATDAGGLTATTSVLLDPQTVDLTFRSNPGGLRVTVTSADSTLATPFTHTYVVRSQVHLIAPTTVVKAGQTYTFQSWSDGGAADHTITAPATATATIYTAGYRKR
jgi:glucose/arabinose dehydrogenase